MTVIGVGIDLVDVDRIERMLLNRGDRMLRRLFTRREAEYCMSKLVPARHLAARLAAKEAGFKALAGSIEARAIGWREIEVQRSASGIPTLVLHGRARERADLLGVTRIHISLTHTDSTAGAVVVVA